MISIDPDAVATQHRAALELVLRPGTDMSTRLILQLHATACGGSLLKTAGTLRKVGVRTGKQHFCPPARVPEEFEQCVRALQRLIAPV